MESDYLVALSYSCNSEGRLLALSWCAYHIVNKTTNEESSLFIHPSGEEIEDLFTSSNLTDTTGLTLHDMESSQDLPSAMQCLNKALYENIILHNANFTLLTYKDNLLCQILPDECVRLGLKLAPHFHKYFDICNEFEKRYSDAGSNLTLNKMLHFLGMIEIPERIVAQQECKTMIRLISRLLKDGHIFASPKDTNSEKIKPKQVIQKPIKKPACILENPVPSRVVMIKGPKSNTEFYEIEEFFYGLHVEKVVSLIDPYGEKSEIFLVKFTSEEDTLEALLYDKRYLKKRPITVEETTEEFFQNAIQNNYYRYQGDKFLVLKTKENSLQGLVPKLTYFFAEYYYFVVEDRPDFVNSSVIRVDEQELLNYLRVGSNIPQVYLTTEQISRAVKIRGFLQNSKKSDVADFLKDFEIFGYNVFIRKGGKEKVGVEIVVILTTPDERERVCRTLSNRLFKNRLIEIYPYS
ncbi:hypothetical protein SteCoe_13300 [Stentor coeruleus]|uniref:RRM domain-containing protein n=1 Tax=Stentor coeruleus TaxID=5963 RepID=A0A1R2C4P6_9CILI|nr:hypothetical protein SteCoe_15012 [Stentor coeruleus]OMJ85390.1 hypothetical protein SteCoe_13300 [Stentor coeruleus]